MEESSKNELDVSLGIKFCDHLKNPNIILSEDRKSASNPPAHVRDIRGPRSYLGICCDNLMKGTGKYKIRYKLTSLRSNWQMYGIIEEKHSTDIGIGKKLDPYGFLTNSIYGWGGVGFVYDDGTRVAGPCIMRKKDGFYDLTLDLINNKIIIESSNQPYYHGHLIQYKLDASRIRLEKSIPKGKEWRFVVVLEYSNDAVTILGDDQLQILEIYNDSIYRFLTLYFDQFDVF